MNNEFSKPDIATESLITIQKLSEQIEIPVGTIYYYVQRHEIPFIRIGRHLRFDLSEVLAYFREQTTQSKDSCLPHWRRTKSKLIRSLKTKAEEEAVP